MTDYFKSVKDPKDKEKADFSGIPKGPLKVSPEEEAKILEESDKRGFRSRENKPAEAEATPNVRRSKGAVKSRSIYIKGPEELMDWFVEFTNEGDFNSYWEALEDLKKRAGA